MPNNKLKQPVEEKQETFSKYLGEGCGCLLICLGIAIIIFVLALVPNIPDIIDCLK